jgi:hypothetical protein
MLAIGPFPTITLAQVRSKRDEFGKLLADGTDPGVKQKLDEIAVATAADNTCLSLLDPILDLGQPGARATFIEVGGGRAADADRA